VDPGRKKKEMNMTIAEFCIKHSACAAVICYMIEAAKRNAVPFRLFVGLAVLLAAAAALYLARICAAEGLAGRAINRHMDEFGYTGTFNNADATAWRPSYFYLHSTQSGYDGTFNSSDVTAWRSTDFNLSSMQSGYDGTFNIADVTAW